MKRTATPVLNKLTLGLPYFAVRRLFSAFAGERSELFSKSPFKYVLSPVKLPDGNQLFWSWEQDAFWLNDMVKEIYQDQAYEHFFNVSEGEVVVDVGANIGVFTLRASKKVGKRGRVIAFEPETSNFKRLSRNIRINRCDNVVLLNVALSNFDGEASFYIKSASVEHTLLRETRMEYATHTIRIEKVNVRKLSSVLNELGISNVDFLKIDAEGAELEVLEGARELLSERKVKGISVAVYHSKEEPEIVQKYLQNMNYRVHSLSTVGLADFRKEHVYARVK